MTLPALRYLVISTSLITSIKTGFQILFSCFLWGKNKSTQKMSKLDIQKISLVGRFICKLDYVLPTYFQWEGLLQFVSSIFGLESTVSVTATHISTAYRSSFLSSQWISHKGNTYIKGIFSDSEETPKQQQPIKCLIFTYTRFHHERPPYAYQS